MTPTSEPPTTGELLRRIEEATRETRDLATRHSSDLAEIMRRLREDRAHADQTFVRQDVYTADRRADAVELVEVRKDLSELNRLRETDAQWRRQVSLSLALLTVSLLVSIALAIVNRLG